MKKYLIFLFLIFGFIGFSQCEDADRFDLGGSYLSRSNNYIIFHLNHKSQNFCDSKLVKKYSDFIIDKSKDYIVKRANEDFYDRLKLYQIEVNYSKGIDSVFNGKEICELSNFEHTYWVLYTYKNKKIKYAFGLEFDKGGNMISENMFPKFSDNKDFEKFIGICDALSVAKADYRFIDKKIDEIELAYLNEINSFCWLIKEKLTPTELGVHGYTVNNCYVNANSGKVEAVKETKVNVVACGYKVLFSKRE